MYKIATSMRGLLYGIVAYINTKSTKVGNFKGILSLSLTQRPRPPESFFIDQKMDGKKLNMQ